MRFWSNTYLRLYRGSPFVNLYGCLPCQSRCAAMTISNALDPTFMVSAISPKPWMERRIFCLTCLASFDCDADPTRSWTLIKLLASIGWIDSGWSRLKPCLCRNNCCRREISFADSMHLAGELVYMVVDEWYPSLPVSNHSRWSWIVMPWQCILSTVSTSIKWDTWEWLFNADLGRLAWSSLVETHSDWMVSAEVRWSVWSAGSGQDSFHLSSAVCTWSTFPCLWALRSG